MNKEGVPPPLLNKKESEKMKIEKIYETLFLLFLFMMYSYSYGDTGGQETGAGNVIRINNEYYFYDLYEMGLQSLESVPEITDFMGAENRVKEILPQDMVKEQKVLDNITFVLNHIYEKSPNVAYALLEAMEAYDWYMNNGTRDIDDMGRTLALESEGIQTVAFRDESRKIIVISKPLYEKLHSLHKAALLIHEAHYILSQNKDSSYDARLLTAFVFNPNFQRKSFERFKNRYLILADDLLILNKEDYSFFISENYQKLCRNLKQKIKESAEKLSLLFFKYTEFVKGIWNAAEEETYDNDDKSFRLIGINNTDGEIFELNIKQTVVKTKEIEEKLYAYYESDFIERQLKLTYRNYIPITMYPTKDDDKKQYERHLYDYPVEDIESMIQLQVDILNFKETEDEELFGNCFSEEENQYIDIIRKKKINMSEPFR